MEPTLLKRFPAIRAQIGDWYYYITSLTFEEVAQRVLPATTLVMPADMNSWIQRRVMPRRASQIASYLIEQDQHFFPGIVVGVYLGRPTWYKIDMEHNAILGTPFLDVKSRDSLGVLELDGTERLYAIDGQHRVAGIKEALKLLDKAGRKQQFQRLADETLSVAFVSADIDDTGEMARVRRLFTTLNKQAKRVSESEIIALDEDDPAAIVTRWLTVRYAGLKTISNPQGDSDHQLVQLGRTAEIRSGNRRSLTTLVTLYRMIKLVFQQELGRLGKENQVSRPSEEILEDLYEQAVYIWELMAECDRAVGDVLGSDPGEERSGKYRTGTGGHMLFRPVGLQAFAGALGVLRKRGYGSEHAVRDLCNVPNEVSEAPWRHVVWNANTNVMIVKHRAVVEALYLHMVGQLPRKTTYDLSYRYGEIVGGSSGDALRGVPVLDPC